jgi:pyrroloquinoline quinone (PQQ) biosynthesis protein C
VQTRAQVESAEGDQLRAKIALVIPALVDASTRLATHPRIADLYPEYLFAVHAVIRASVPLMETARERAEDQARDDPVSAGLARYLAEHIPEERDHDEWLLEDLEAIGVDRSAILGRPPSATIAAVVGAQYYWIFHYHPVALLGYIAVLEGYPPTVELLDEMVARTGYRPEAFRTLIQHAELDPGHRAELDSILDGLPLTQEQSAAVGVSALYTVQMLTRCLEEISNESELS